MWNNDKFTIKIIFCYGTSQESSASTDEKQLDSTLQEKETASVLTFDQLVSQCQSAMFHYYDSTPEVPLYDPAVKWWGISVKSILLGCLIYYWRQ